MGSLFSKKKYQQVQDEEKQGIELHGSSQSQIKNKSSWKNSVKLFLFFGMPLYWPPDYALRFYVLVVMFLLFASKGLSVMVPLLFRNIIDALPDKVLVTPLILYAVTRFLSGNLTEVQNCLWLHVENNATRTIAVSSFRHLLYLNLQFHLSRKTGAVLRILERGKSALSSLSTTIFFTLIPAAFEFILAISVIISGFGFWYGLIIVVSMAAYVSSTFLISEWRIKFRRAVNEKDNESSNAALDALTNFETIKYFTTEEHEIARYNKKQSELFRASIKSSYSLSMLNVIQSASVNVGLISSLVLSVYQVHKGTLTTGELIAINMYVLQVFAPLAWLGVAYRMISSGFTDIEQLYDLFNEESDVKDSPGAEDLDSGSGVEIEFCDVTFTYPKRSKTDDKSPQKPQQPTLQGVSFKIAPGQTLALVGTTGSGKTTAGRLLCRFYDTDSGSVLINGKDVRRLKQDSLRKAIGVVPQDTVLFNDTIYYNIEYGKASKDKSEATISVEEAAKRAQLHDMIAATPQGYDTIVGERGLRLSGGEKQRVAIARTILRDPKILILDEATSALDSKTEKEIQSSLIEVSKGRTTLIIAHRLSTIVNADCIVVLKHGVIVEKGTHKELLDLNGEYKTMWELQSQKEEKNNNNNQ